MGRVHDFLSGLDDYELAYFAKFKRSTYLVETQEKISQFLIERGLTGEVIEQLIDENPAEKLSDGRKRCPRCYSDKLRSDKVEWRMTAGRKGLEDEAASIDGIIGRATYKERVICNVCGYWVKDPNQEKNKPWWQTATDFLVDLFSRG